MGYLKKNFTCKARDGRKIDITAYVVIGKPLECCWKLACRPEVGFLPIPVEVQRPSDIQTVIFSRFYLDDAGIGRKLVLVHEKDAVMALKIAREVMCVFFAPPYSMQVLTCDHSGPSRSEAHDLLLSPLLNASAWTPALYSLEVVCRDVGRELGFN